MNKRKKEKYEKYRSFNVLTRLKERIVYERKVRNVEKFICII